MSGITICIAIIGTGLAAMNAATTRRIWRSPAFEHPQKVTQTMLVWLLPGSFMLVGAVLSQDQPKQRDPTIHDAPGLDPTGIDVGLQ
jgi:hypothetical protein